MIADTQTVQSRAKWLLGLFACSILILVASQRFHSNSVWGMLPAGLPLAIYHWVILAPQRNGRLAPAEVDSVYYFGFLLTIASLEIGRAHV